MPARPVILFVPGGAFITDFEAADLFFLHRWVRETRATVAYVSYGFSPQAPPARPAAGAHRLPRARDGPAAQLGFAPNRSSSPGCRRGQPRRLGDPRAAAPAALPRGGARALPPPAEAAMPDAVLLLCPVLNVCRSPSPSRTAFSSDVLLPQPLLKAYAEAYDQGNEGAWMDRDPLLSPVFAPDAALQRLPPTHILVGGLDPLLDDSVDFNTRIRRMGVAGELRLPLAPAHLRLVPALARPPEVQAPPPVDRAPPGRVLAATPPPPRPPRRRGARPVRDRGTNRRRRPKTCRCRCGRAPARSRAGGAVTFCVPI